MPIKLYTSILLIYFAFLPFQTQIDAISYSKLFEISDQQKSDPKASNFVFSTNVNFTDGGSNEKFYCLADCLKNEYTDEDNEDQKNRTGNSELLRQLILKRLALNSTPQSSRKLSENLVENIGLNKSTKASPFYGHDGHSPYLPRYAVDGDLVSSYVSNNLVRPWWIVELEDTYNIVKISYYSKPGSKDRGLGVQFYVADQIPFLCNGGPDISNLTLFGERIANPIRTDKTDHEVPNGHFGRKVLVYKPTVETYLEIVELQIAGYLYK